VWERWGERAGVPRSVLFAALGATIERRGDHRALFSHLGTTFERVVHDDDVEAYALYPDALRCLERLHTAGLRVGAVGNQPQSVERWLRDRVGAAVLVASSASWGIAKPDARFFERVLDLAGCPAEEVAYVGDRVDNDVLPAAAAGMRTVLVRRGPWGVIQSGWPEAARADALVDDLDEAVEAILGL
jgi:HAD superfamily hydrolase (TIGR01549 family)